MKVIEYWVEVARESFNIGNFNSLMAIIAGLNLSPVARLKKTVSVTGGVLFSSVRTKNKTKIFETRFIKFNV